MKTKKGKRSKDIAEIPSHLSIEIDGWKFCPNMATLVIDNEKGLCTPELTTWGKSIFSILKVMGCNHSVHAMEVRVK